MSKNLLAITRRTFLQSAALAMPWVLCHSHAPVCWSDEPEIGTADRSIKRLRLLGRKLDEQRQFYAKVLELAVTDDSTHSITVQAGPSRITFVDEQPEYQNPFYHFCFLIPENKLESARTWLSKRWPLIVVNGQQVFHFRQPGAHSIYFLDPAGNIGEFIAHHSLQNGQPGEFTPADILQVNEIGVVVDDVPKIMQGMKDTMKLGACFPATRDFAAMGTPAGSFIIVQKERRWFPERKTPSIVCPTEATIVAPQAAEFAIEGLPYKLSLEAAVG